ncbi:MAG: BTAD domain-containing putative transcriptional regulator [Solirubrobacterales bacterium]
MSSSGPSTQRVPRPRLAEGLLGARVGLIEAGGGYGKSVLASEVAEQLGTPSAVAVLERATEDPDELVGAIRRGLRSAGLSDSAAALAGADPAAVVAALEVGEDPVLLVVEEAQRIGGAAVELLAGVARELGSGPRLIIVGRRLHPTLASLAADAGAQAVDARALCFDEREIAAVVAAATGEEADEHDAAAIARLTAGWPAAVALVAARIPRDRGVGHRPLAGEGLLAELLDELLADLDERRRAQVVRLAHLPLLSDRVAAACAGEGGLAAVLDSGLPLREGRAGWLELADPVREELAGRESLDPASARAAASAYADAGELATGLALLSGLPDGEGVAALLGSRRWQELEPMAPAELKAILSTLPEDALAAEPFALVQVARLAEQQADLDATVGLLGRAVGFAPEGAARREVEAELVAAEAMLTPSEAVETRAISILDDAGADEPRARARALAALGRIDAWRGKPATMLKAERHLTESAALCRIAGETEWEARTLTALGYRVEFERGDLDQAVDHMSEALALLPGFGTERAAAATFLAEALGYVGRYDDAEAAIGEASAIGRKLGDHRVQAYAAWTGAVVASLRGDAASTVQRIRAVERHPGDWFEHPTGIEFLADAALALARTGAADAAADYAERARLRAEAAGYPEIAWAAVGAVAARWGDPDEAEEALTAFAASPQQAPRDEWRTLLFRALAAARRNAKEAGGLAAQAYEAAAELGRPDLPAAQERDVAAAVQPLAAAAGSRAASEAAVEGGRFTIALLGGFAVSEGAEVVEVPPGRPATLVKMLALGAGSIPAEAAIEALWPGVDEKTGRGRLRNLLNRLRASCGELVSRDGGSIALGPADTDAAGFERAADAALEAAPEERAGLARTALARYAGELLPDDRYETWATAPRERLRRRYLELLDLLTDEAVERGDVDEAIRLLDQAQETEPLDEDRYLRAAELLLFQGRRGSARELVGRAVEVCSRLGLEESSRLARLRAATTAA